MKIIEYDKSYDEEIKDLLVELQEYLVEIDDWKTQVLYDNYREEIFKIDMRKVEKQKGKIYLAIENNCVAGLIIGVVESKDEIDIITNDCAITGKILELIVSKNSRGKGIGKELLNKMENYFNSINCERVTIEVFAPNKKAYNFYNENGYIDRDIFVSKKLNYEADKITMLRVEENKELYMNLLLEADPDKNVVMKYIYEGDMYILKKGKNILAEIVVTDIDDETCELKNIATAEDARGKGYASRMIKYVFDIYKKKYKRMIVGTTENMIPFYVLNGFTKYHHTIKNFFVDNYDKEVWDGDLHCIDMYYYSKEF